MSDSDQTNPIPADGPVGSPPEQTAPPEQPVQPVQPSGQANPDAPSQNYPAQPAQPGQPQYRPVQPGQPGQPGQPQYRPAQPGQPGQPGQPQYRPAQPGQPGQPQYRPAQPGQPQQPFAQATQSPQAPSEAHGQGASVSPDSYPFRLLPDEEVMGTYPLTRMSRPLGKLASFIFVTDSRVIYAAESKTVTSRSYQIKEFAISKVHGVEIESQSGLGAFAAGIMGGLIVNVLVLLGSLGLGAGELSGFPGPFLWFLLFFTVIVGVIAYLVLRSPMVFVSLLSEQGRVEVAKSSDNVKQRVTVVMLFVLALFVPLILLLWLVGRELGIFRAEDSVSYVNPDFVDRLSRDLGAQIVEIQAMGKMATRR